MIQQSFIHLPRCGEVTEQRLWEAGVVDWQTALDGRLAAAGKAALATFLSRSPEALARRDWGHFGKLLNGRHTWRWFDELRHRAVYLDIETDGGLSGWHAVTVIACYDGGDVRCFVKGDDLEQFPAYLADYELVVTYNGASFDLPCLQAQFGAGLRLPPVHLDLRFPLARLGLRGGLKQIEQVAGVGRASGLAELDGWCAVLLWRRHRAGDRRALPTLLRYAAEDVVGLEPLAALAYNRLSADLPLSVAPVDCVVRAALDWPYDEELVAELARWA